MYSMCGGYTNSLFSVRWVNTKNCNFQYSSEVIIAIVQLLGQQRASIVNKSYWYFLSISRNGSWLYLSSIGMTASCTASGSGLPHLLQKNAVSYPKSSIEVTKCTSSNILVWFGRVAPEKSVAGLRESLLSSPFEKFAKGLEKYRK